MCCDIRNGVHRDPKSKLTRAQVTEIEAAVARPAAEGIHVPCAAPQAAPRLPALEALAYHGYENLKSQRLIEFLRHEDPAVRSAAWRIVALGDAAIYP
ncbi:MAG: hypothetical protein ACLP9L_11290 [Thermoguttaceae bacterium]